MQSACTERECTMYEKECTFLQNTAKMALRKYLSAPKDIQAKAEYDVVTAVDTGVEQFVIDEIHRNYPKDTILSEESHPTEGLGKRTWVLDPIDGTWNFMGGSPLFGFQGAFCVDGKPVAAVIILPMLREEYYAIKGKGAYCNGKKITVSPKENLHQTIVSFSDYNHEQPLEKQPVYQMQQRLYNKIGRMRGFGASCFDFTGVAGGRTDAYVLVTHNLWDVLPGAFLCKEAGAYVCDITGRKYQTNADGIVVAGSEKLKNVIVSAITGKSSKPRRRNSRSGNHTGNNNNKSNGSAGKE